MSPDFEAVIARQIDRYRQRLLDPSLRNPLLNYRPSRRRTVTILDVAPDEIYRRLLENQIRCWFAPRPTEGIQEEEWDEQGVYGRRLVTAWSGVPTSWHDQAFSQTRARGLGESKRNTLHVDVSEDRLEAVLTFIRREASAAIEETGINYLYMALGMLEWKEADQSNRRLLAPLVLIPVQVEREFDGRSSCYRHAVRWTGEEVEGNLCLAKRLENDFGIRLPVFDGDVSPSDYLAQVQQCVDDQTDWKVLRTVTLGFFSFQKMLMYLDIAPDHWQSQGVLSEGSVASTVIWGDQSDLGTVRYLEDYDIDSLEEAKNIPIVLDTDSSQHSALVDIVQGKSLVVEGPPGTGKSQTITNAIAAAMASGKTVLFVAEKLAALEVVKSKLSQCGLGEFCLELHSDAATAQKVIASLDERLRMKAPAPKGLEELRGDLERQQKRIAEYLEASSQPVGPYQWPVHQLLGYVVRERQAGRVALSSAKCHLDLSREEFEHRIDLLRAFGRILGEIESPRSSPWWGFWPVRLNPNSREAVQDTLETLRRLASDVTAVEQALTDALNETAGASLLEWATSGGRLLCSSSEHFLDLGQRSVELALPESLSILCQSGVIQTAEKLAQLVERRAALQEAVRPFLQKDFLEVAESAAEILRLAESQFASVDRNSELAAVRERIASARTVASLCDQALEMEQTLQEQGIVPIENLQDLKRGADIWRLVRHPIVGNRREVPEASFYSSAFRILKSSKKLCEELLRQKERLSDAFHLPSVPSRSVVLGIASNLRPHAASRLRWLRRPFRQAMKQLATFWHPAPGKSVAKWIRDLEALAAWQQDVLSFEVDPSCIDVFGEQFQGLETDWEKCELLLRWSKTAKKYGLDHSTACQLLNLREEVGLSGEQIKKLCDDLKGELRLNDFLSEELPVGIFEVEMIPIQQLQHAASRYADCWSKLLQLAHDFLIPQNATLGELFECCQNILELQALEAQLNDDSFPEVLGPWKEVGVKDPGQLRKAIAWTRDFLSLELPDHVVHCLLRASVGRVAKQIGELMERYNALHESWKSTHWKLRRCGELSDDWLAWNPGMGGGRLMQQQLERCLQSLEELPAWCTFSRELRRCQEVELESFTNAVLEGDLAPNEVAECYRFTVLERIADTVIEENEPLREFSRPLIEQARQRYQELDRAIIEANRQWVAYLASQRIPPPGNRRGRVSERTEMGLIRHEIMKQRRHCRIRELLKRAGRAVQALKPCFMMSPLSVAKFLDPKGIEFDLVIIDEASQVKPEDAIGVLLRSKQIVVVGDPKQLPPTSFFEKLEEEVDDEDATQFDNSESILEVATKAFQPVRRLRWHYRSLDERLIHFSNEKFYDGDLIVFPTAHHDRARLGLRHHFISDGYFENRHNPVEAKIVAEAIARHILKSPGESLGVGTFNQRQMEAIEDEFDRLCERDSRLRLALEEFNKKHEPLFIKNLERLQGDERDVVFISYTYGVDRAAKKVMNRFGPITGPFGWRRLNVLITRARRRVEVFTSIRPGDISAGPGKSRGVNAMREYLEYCEACDSMGQGEISGGTIESPFEESVAQIIESMGMEVIPQVGVAGYFIDLGVRKPGGSRFLLGVECDGATYHSAKSARDRDRLREEVIRSRGWRLHRIWSTDWYQNRHHEVGRLERAIKAALAEGG